MTTTEPARVHASDPPWQFEQGESSEDGKFRGTVGDHYPTMSVTQIALMPMPLLDFNAVTFCWRVASMQPEALQVIKAWGFTVKAELVWLKRTKNGKRHFGMGRYVRNEHETCLIATRGKVEVKVKNIRSTFEAPVPLTPDGRPWHSAKPDKFYQIVTELCHGPYVETFARRVRPGWRCYGNEVPAPDAVEKWDGWADGGLREAPQSEVARVVGRREET